MGDIAGLPMSPTTGRTRSPSPRGTRAVARALSGQTFEELEEDRQEARCRLARHRPS